MIALLVGLFVAVLAITWRYDRHIALRNRIQAENRQFQRQ